MKLSIRITISAAIALGAASANAQQCVGGTAARDGCRKMVDLVNFLSPQLAAALSGGNPTAAQSGSLGGLGKVAVAVRSTRVIGALPDIDRPAGAGGFATTGEAASTYASPSTQIPALSVDGAFGIVRGFAAGATHIGGVDALLSATYMSQIGAGSVNVALEGSNTNFGFGARVGIIEETNVLPGISVSYMKRDMPRFTVSAITAKGNGGAFAPGTLTGHSLLVTSTSMRLTLGKQLGPIDLTAGGGQDKYVSSSNVTAVVNAAAPIGTQTATGVAAMEMTRINGFAGAAVNIAVFKIVAEVGMATGGTAPAAVNSFGSAANAARTYFSLAFRIGF